MNGVFNPIIKSLNPLDREILRLIKRTQSCDQCWVADFSDSLPFPKPETTPYLSMFEYLPILDETEEGFESELLQLLVRAPDGSFAQTQGILYKAYGTSEFIWQFKEIRLNVVGWKPFLSQQ